MKLLRYICFSLAAGFFLASCDKADDDYKDFAPGGEITYPGKVDSLKSNPGYKRTQLTWLLKTDMRVVKCRIFWNRGADSAEIAIKRTNSVDTIKHILNLAEGPYVFNVYTYDAEGNRSIKQELNADVYGDFYQTNLINRILKTATIVSGNAKLDWDEPDPRSPGVMLYYKDQNGVDQTRLVPSSEKTTTLTGAPQTGTMTFKTLYLPVPNAIDTFKAAAVKVNL